MSRINELCKVLSYTGLLGVYFICEYGQVSNTIHAYTMRQRRYTMVIFRDGIAAYRELSTAVRIEFINSDLCIENAIRV